MNSISSGQTVLLQDGQILMRIGTYMWNSMPDFMPKVIMGVLGPRLEEDRAKEITDG
jgi:hypothetical protein